MQHQELLIHLTKRPQVRHHDMAPFGFLDKIAGLGVYPARAVGQRGQVRTAFQDNASYINLKQNHRCFREAAIGADELILVHGDNLSEATMEEDRTKRTGHRDRILRAINDAGMPIEFYKPRGMQPFIKWLGIGPEKISSPTATIAETFDDKHELRCLGAGDPKMQSVFTPWELVSLKGLEEKDSAKDNFDAVIAARDRILRKAALLIPTTIVYLKVHDYDGGAGIMELREGMDDELKKFLAEYAGHALIIDAGYPKGEFETTVCSLKVLIDDYSWKPLYFSEMIIENNSHKGNAVALGQRVLPEAIENMAMERFSPFIDKAVEMGYGRVLPRTACVDFLWVKYRGRNYIFMLEWNARPSASDYAMAPCVEALDRFACGQAAVWMENVSGIPKNLSYDQARDSYFKGKPWDGSSTPGFLLINAGCLSVAGKLTALTVAPTVEEAKEMFTELVPPKEETSRRHLRLACAS